MFSAFQQFFITTALVTLITISCTVDNHMSERLALDGRPPKISSFTLEYFRASQLLGLIGLGLTRSYYLIPEETCRQPR